MIRFWCFAASCLGAAALMGCSQGGQAVYVGAPDPNFSTSYTVRDPGQYTLYRVTKWTQDGQPEHAEKLATYDLRAREQLGFHWVTDHSRMYDPDASLNLEAYAGGNRVNLGPIVSRQEKYYWADPNGWNGYWAGAGARQLNDTIMMR